MPQKLIRLTCESNDGIFNGKFDEDIFIKKDSEMAFQSLTLEQTPDELIVSTENDTISFVSRVFGVEKQVARIQNGEYTKSTRNNLLNNIAFAMNSVCDMVARPTQMNSQWGAVVTDKTKELVEIICRPSPFFPLAVYNTRDGANVPLYNTEIERGVPVRKGVANAATPEMGAGGLVRLTQSAVGLLNECYLFSQWPFIKSTGSWRIQLGRMTLGTDNRPAFTLGMVNAAGLLKLTEGTIEMTDLVYAIQVNQQSVELDQGGYAYVNRVGTAAPVETNPFVKIEQAGIGGVAQDENDVIEIVIRNNKLQGYIHQLTGGRTDLPEGLPLGQFEHLYAVVFIHLASTDAPVVNNQIRALQCSFDPLYQWTGGLNDRTSLWATLTNANQQLEPNRSDLPTTQLYDPPNGSSLAAFNTIFEFESLDISNFLGFSSQVLAIQPDTADSSTAQGIGAVLTGPDYVVTTNPLTGIKRVRAIGYLLTAKSVQPFSLDGDSFLIDTQTFMLDSYDSYGLSFNERASNSGGSRRNILTTIPHQTVVPIQNSENSRIVYEPNTLDYIAIRNKSDIITRQLRMRLLTARYGPVATVGMATMTVLIRDPD